MQVKKSKKADLEWKKPVFLEIGLAVALALVLVSFECVGSRDKEEVMITGAAMILDDEVMIQTEQIKETPPPPPQQTTTIVEIVADNIKVEDFNVDAEADEDTQVEEVEYSIEDTKEEEVVEAEIFQVVEQLPEFPGGDEALFKYLSDNLEYPARAREAGIEGRVMVGFVVEPDGRISNVKVVRSKAAALDEEAIRVVKAMPKWKPGKQRGKAVRVQYQIPITFTLN